MFPKGVLLREWMKKYDKFEKVWKNYNREGEGGGGGGGGGGGVWAGARI